MYLTESEYLLRNGVAGKTIIEAVDAFLADRSREDVLDAELVARHISQDVSEVSAVLGALAEHGALAERRMVRCPDQNCRVYTPADRVEQSREDGDEEPCDGPCGQDLAALDDLVVVNTYTLVAQPV